LVRHAREKCLLRGLVLILAFWLSFHSLTHECEEGSEQDGINKPCDPLQKMTTTFIYPFSLAPLEVMYVWQK
jgi:hypothetical protein